MWTRTWWKDATERAVKSGAQAVVLSWALGDQLLNALAIDWQAAAGFAAGGALLSYLTSLASMLRGSASSASLVAGPSLPQLSPAELTDLAAKRLDTEQALQLAERVADREEKERAR